MVLLPSGCSSGGVVVGECAEFIMVHVKIMKSMPRLVNQNQLRKIILAGKLERQGNVGGTLWLFGVVIWGNGGLKHRGSGNYFSPNLPGSTNSIAIIC